jgi:hypothetical protein
VILIDALDESLEHPGIGIIDIIPRVSDPDFPDNLRIVMTSRRGAHLATFRRDDLVYLDDQLAGHLENHKNDVRELIDKRLAEPPFVAVMKEWKPEETDAYKRDLESRSEWNYLYIHYYLAEVVDSLQKGNRDLRSVPILRGLDEIYRVFAMEKIRKNPLDRLQFATTGSLSDSVRSLLREIDGVVQARVDHDQVEIMTASGDNTLLKVFSVASENRITITDLKIQKGTESGVWEEKYIPLLGVLAVAYEALSRMQLSEFAGVDSAYVDSVIAHLRQFLDVERTQDADLYKLYHRSFAEYLLDHKRNRDYAVDGGVDRLISRCWHWSSLSNRGSRDYILRRGLDHMLNRDLADEVNASTSALNLCRHADGKFLFDAVRSCGVQRVAEAAQHMFQGYLLKRRWNGAAGALVHLRALGNLETPLDVVLAGLDSAAKAITPDPWRRGVDAITDGNQQRAIAFVTLGWLDAHESEEVIGKLLAWLEERHRGSMTLGLDQLDSECLRALLACGSIRLAERIVDLPLYSSPREQLSALAWVWARDPDGHLRSRILERLAATQTDREPFSFRTLHYIAAMASVSADDDVLLEAARAIGDSNIGANIETLDLTGLLQRPEATIVECVRRLCKNKRLRAYPSLRASVAGLILLGTAPRQSAVLEKLTLDLAQTTGASIPQILAALAGHAGLQAETASMSLTEFRRWFTARVDLLIQLRGVAGTDDDCAIVDPMRRFVCEISKFTRWQAAQADISDANWSELAFVLRRLSTLIWHDPRNWDTPFAFSERSVFGPEADPIRAYAAADTVAWLAQEGWPASLDRELHARSYHASVSEVARLVFGERSEPHMEELHNALLAASGAPKPKERGSLRGSPWLEVFRAIAVSARETWRAQWTGTLDRDDTLPDHFKSHLGNLRGRVAEVADAIGFHPCLLELSYYLAFTTNELDPTDDELTRLYVPAVAHLDPRWAPFILQEPTWPPPLVPLPFARTVPAALSRVIASVELCDRGMLWRLARDLCRADMQPAWLQSISEFRETLRRKIEDNPHPRIIWYRNDTPAEEFVEAALAPVNLLLDRPPKKADFDLLAGEVNIDPSGSCVRLKQLITVHPDSELLRWAAEEFSSWSSRQAAWVAGVLLRYREWGLLRAFLKSHFLRDAAEGGQGLLFADETDRSERAGGSPVSDWEAQLREAVGIGPEETLIYRIPELSQQARNQTLLQDDQIRQYAEKIKYGDHWEERLRRVWHLQVGRQDEFIRTLLVVALLRGEPATALLADELVKSATPDLERALALDLAWTGSVVCNSLANDERLTQIATDPNGLALLVSLRRWDLVERHLDACAPRQPHSSYVDPLLQWYHQCDSLPSADEKRCLAIFVSRAPNLLSQRPENADVGSRQGIDALLPVVEVSATLRFSESSLGKRLLSAALAEDRERLVLWFQAVLIEARYGPGRTRDLGCLGAVCRCAGILLAVLDEQQLRAEWFKAIRQLSAEFTTRQLWNSFFCGAGMVLGAELSRQLQRWYVAGDTGATLALGEELAEYGNSGDVRDYWKEQVDEEGSPWVALRACGAVAVRSGSSEQKLKLARDFVALAWDLARSTGDLSDPIFLGQLVSLSVRSRCGSVLSGISQLMSGDAKRAQEIGRIALDSCLGGLELETVASAEKQKEDMQSLCEFLMSPGFRPLLAAIVEDGAGPRKEPEELTRYQHAWHAKNVQSGIEWIAVLLDESAKRGQPFGLARWIADWIQKINCEQDREWKVAEQISRLCDGESAAGMAEVTPILDFAIRSAACSHGALGERVDLILNLVRARYRVRDCLAILDRSFEERSQTAYVDDSLARVAGVTAELFPIETIADDYLAKMKLPASKAAAVDEVSELRNRPRPERLQNLTRAPQSSEVINRTVILCETMIEDMMNLTLAELDALSGALVRLIPSHTVVYRQAGMKISQMLERADLVRIHEDQQRLCSLFAAGT